MYTPQPLEWYDTNRITAKDIESLRAHGSAFIPMKLGDGPPFGYVAPRWPTPDELFHWSPKP